VNGFTAVQTATVVLVTVKLSCKKFWLATREPLRKSGGTIGC